ncbi:MAG: metal/formaldehyde-sensitive transcriptional repressor [Qingshengfaniella sp.]
MSHTIRDKTRLVARVRRIKGQIEGIERAFEAETSCAELLRQIASARGAMTGLTREVMEDHLREHIADAPTDRDRRDGVDEMIDILRTYLK